MFTQPIPSYYKPLVLRCFHRKFAQTFRCTAITILACLCLIFASPVRAEQSAAPAISPTVPAPKTGEAGTPPETPAPPPAPSAEDPVVTDLRKEGLTTIRTLLAARTEPFAVDMLIDGAPKLVDLVKIDADFALHYKQFGRPGTVAFADLTPSQVAGLLVALLSTTGDEIQEAPPAHLQAGLLYRVLGKDLESSNEIAKATALNPDLEPTVADRLKALPKPPPPPDAPALPLMTTGGEATASGETTRAGLANLPGGTAATELSVAPSSTNWPPKDIPIPAGKRRIPGLIAPVGPNTQPNCVEQLNIDAAGVYENYLVDGRFDAHNLVNIKADRVVFRNSEVRNSNFNGVQVYAKDVLIENCKIHHLANGSSNASLDAHGITGCPTRLVVRNCAIYQFSGDGLQFDPNRGPWNDVLIEHCEIWLAPLDIKIAGWKKGEIPGENALDTKTPGKGQRARVTVRHCVFHGFTGAAPTAGIRAALNLKENIDATVEDCVFYNNDLGLRLRGPGEHGGAKVNAKDCYFYQGIDGIRYENNIQGLTLTNMAFANDIQHHYDKNSTAARDLRITGDTVAPALSEMLPPKTR